MSLARIQIAFATLAALLLIAAPALAEDQPPPGPGMGHQRAEFCKENPQQCEEQRARMKQKRAERQEFCKQNPEKCEEQRARRQERRAEFQAKCAADPAKCEQMKQERRERFQKRHGGAKAPAGAGQLPSDSASPPPE